MCLNDNNVRTMHEPMYLNAPQRKGLSVLYYLAYQSQLGSHSAVIRSSLLICTSRELLNNDIFNSLIESKDDFMFHTGCVHCIPLSWRVKMISCFMLDVCTYVRIESEDDFIFHAGCTYICTYTSLMTILCFMLDVYYVHASGYMTSLDFVQSSLTSPTQELIIRRSNR